jgi:hypothetical protein
MRVLQVDESQTSRRNDSLSPDPTRAMSDDVSSLASCFGTITSDSPKHQCLEMQCLQKETTAVSTLELRSLLSSSECFSPCSASQKLGHICAFHPYFDNEVNFLRCTRVSLVDQMDLLMSSRLSQPLRSLLAHHPLPLHQFLFA